jgi:putative NADH-flavin reductase
MKLAVIGAAGRTGLLVAQRALARGHQVSALARTQMRSFPVLDRLFGGQYEDMRRMETILHASDVDWIALRPPRLR